MIFSIECWPKEFKTTIWILSISPVESYQNSNPGYVQFYVVVFRTNFFQLQFCFCLSLFFDWAISNGKTSFWERIKKFFFLSPPVVLYLPPLHFYWSNKRPKQVKHRICWRTSSGAPNTNVFYYTCFRYSASAALSITVHKISFSIKLFYSLQMNTCE